MYQVFGIAKYLHYFGLIAAALACFLVAFTDAPATGAFRIASLVVAVLIAVTLAAGQTSVFPWLCRKTALRHVFPDIDGDWNVELESNWPEIAAREGIETPGEAPADEYLSGTITIRARLFAVHMKLEMDTGYSASKTLFVRVEKDAAGTFNLHYVYENQTLKPVETDSDSHFGAASLELKTHTGAPILKGRYWTNRNWEKARNTAGLVTLRRR